MYYLLIYSTFWNKLSCIIARILLFSSEYIKLRENIWYIVLKVTFRSNECSIWMSIVVEANMSYSTKPFNHIKAAEARPVHSHTASHFALNRRERNTLLHLMLFSSIHDRAVVTPETLNKNNNMDTNVALRFTIWQ